MSDEEWQVTRMARADWQEENVEHVDLSHKLRQGIELCLHLAPVVVGAPVADELLDLRALDALGSISDRLPVGPACGQHASAQVDECLFRNVDAEGADGEPGRCRFVGLGFHTVLLCFREFQMCRLTGKSPFWRTYPSNHMMPMSTNRRHRRQLGQRPAERLEAHCDRCA